MIEYPKIQTLFLRDPNTKYKTLLEGKYAKNEFEELADEEWELTEKVDGTNIRVTYEKGVPIIKGRTDNANIPGFLFNRLMEIFSKTEAREGVVLFGEGYGNKIQKGGGNYVKGCEVTNDFTLFDVYDDGRWCSRKEVQEIADSMGLRIVPVIGIGTLEDMVTICKHKFYSTYGVQDFFAEGVVARPKEERTNEFGERVITKLKFKDFNV